MRLLHPFKISARLLPALEIGGAWLSLECVGVHRDHLVYRWYIDMPGGAEFSDDDLGSPGRGTDAENDQRMFAAFLDFLTACGEGLRYQESTGRESENADLFPPAVAEWARANSDELTMLREEVEPSEGPMPALLTEEE